MACMTCNRPAENGYMRPTPDRSAIAEMCCDPCHGPYLTPISGRAARFIAFHGKRKARSYMNARRLAA